MRMSVGNLTKKCLGLLKYVAIVLLLYVLIKYDFNLVIITRLLFSGSDKSVAVNVELGLYQNQNENHGKQVSSRSHVETNELYVENWRVVSGGSEEFESLIDFYNFKLDLIERGHSTKSGKKEATAAAAAAAAARKFNSSAADDLPPCPFVPHGLVGRIPVDEKPLSYKELDDKFKNEFKSPSAGGWWRPRECKTNNRVAIVVPYRNRDQHLRLFLNHMHLFLQKQSIEYSIYIVEQDASVEEFNRAILLNIGFKEALKDADWHCFIFHDVDLVPQSDLNLYYCPWWPRHMSIEVNTLEYALPYKEIFGGVSAIKRKHFELINGYSNLYFGWGGEDDDLSERITSNDLKIIRYPSNIGTYFMLSHQKEKPSKRRYVLLESARKRFKTDGLNSLKYEVLKKTYHRLYTWILVKFDSYEPARS